MEQHTESIEEQPLALANLLERLVVSVERLADAAEAIASSLHSVCTDNLYAPPIHEPVDRDKWISRGIPPPGCSLTPEEIELMLENRAKIFVSTSEVSVSTNETVGDDDSFSIEDS